jgi:hypothetical protein
MLSEYNSVLKRMSDLAYKLSANDNECFPDYSKMEQQMGKGRVPRREREVVGAVFIS